MSKHIDLTYLESMSGGENEIIVEMIELFKMQVPEFIEEADNAMNNKDWKALGALAHKAKSSVAIMGMNELVDDLNTLETRAKAKENIETYFELVERFKFICIESIVELDEAVANL